jgi:hypothetical protein
MKSSVFGIAVLALVAGGMLGGIVAGCTNPTVQAPPSSPAPPAAPASPPPASTSQKPTPPESPAVKASAEAASPAIEQPAPASKAAPVSSDCNYAAGTAVGGQAINVDLCSVQAKGAKASRFVYYLDNDRVESEADCAGGTWTTFPEGKVNQPQSQATQNMLRAVCNRKAPESGVTSRAGSAIVFDPPSNVRVSPNGDILCSVKQKTTINIYGSSGSWYKTDICGSMGFIHAEQLKF